MSRFYKLTIKYIKIPKKIDENTNSKFGSTIFEFSEAKHRTVKVFSIKKQKKLIKLLTSLAFFYF